MIIPDTNLLLYAYVDSMPLHKEARSWWEQLMAGDEAIGIAWVVLMGFVRLTTNRHVLVNPITAATW
jgi:uncharacterized protein